MPAKVDQIKVFYTDGGRRFHTNAKCRGLRRGGQGHESLTLHSGMLPRRFGDGARFPVEETPVKYPCQLCVTFQITAAA